jgi:hypothetical protein
MIQKMQMIQFVSIVNWIQMKLMKVIDKLKSILNQEFQSCLDVLHFVILSKHGIAQEDFRGSFGSFETTGGAAFISFRPRSDSAEIVKNTHIRVRRISASTQIDLTIRTPCPTPKKSRLNCLNLH